MSNTNEQKNGIVCPKCGSDRLQISTNTDIHTTGKGFSSGKGCLGFLLFGPIGLLCGACGSKQKTTVTNTSYWVCSNCGNKFPNFDDLRNEIAYEKKMNIISMIVGYIVTIIALNLLISIFIRSNNGSNPVPLINIIYTIIYIVGCIICGAGMSKKEKELKELEDSMNKFR